MLHDSSSGIEAPVDMIVTLKEVSVNSVCL